MSRMKEELDKLANEIDTMKIATTIIEVLDEHDRVIDKENFERLWNNFTLHGLYKGLEDSMLFGAINWEG